MAKLKIQITPKQNAWLKKHAGKRGHAVIYKKHDGEAVLVSLHTDPTSAFVAEVFKGDSVLDFLNFFSVCEVEIVEPMDHPAFNWIANRVWGRDYWVCTPDQRVLVDLAKVNKHGNIDLSWKELCGLSLEKANLEDADLTRTRLFFIDLEHAVLEGANMTDACVADTNFFSVNLENSNITRVVLERNNMMYAKLHGATIADGMVCTDGVCFFITTNGDVWGTLELYKCDTGWFARRGCNSESGKLPEFLDDEEKYRNPERGKFYRKLTSAICD